MAAFDLTGEWVKVADAADDPVTVQVFTPRGDFSRGDFAEVYFTAAGAAPGTHTEGLRVPDGEGVTRLHGTFKAEDSKHIVADNV
jgi:hypothetical protein